MPAVSAIFLLFQLSTKREPGGGEGLQKEQGEVSSPHLYILFDK